MNLTPEQEKALKKALLKEFDQHAGLAEYEDFKTPVLTREALVAALKEALKTL